MSFYLVMSIIAVAVILPGGLVAMHYLTEGTRTKPFFERHGHTLVLIPAIILPLMAIIEWVTKSERSAFSLFLYILFLVFGIIMVIVKVRTQTH